MFGAELVVFFTIAKGSKIKKMNGYAVSINNCYFMIQSSDLVV